MKENPVDNTPSPQFGANRISQSGFTIALIIPFIALGLQMLLWNYIAPFVWFLFFPAVFFSARLGRRLGGLFSAIISTALVIYFFIPPQFSWKVNNPYSFFSVIMFLGMGYLFSDIQERVWQANQRIKQALDETRTANETITKLYERTLELDELKTQFFANVSHELRTPLMLIMGPVRKAIESAKLDSETRRYLEVVERNARFLHRHVNDLLDVSKLDAGSMEIRYAQIDLARITRIVASQFDVVADERGICYAIIAPKTLHAQADMEKFQRILLNLLSNAFKFTPDQGQVELSLATDSDAAMLQVSDSGPGIPEDKRNNIFERFRQLEGNAARKHGGTGLGLSIVKEFVDLHHGNIKVEDSPKGGALFTICIPLSAPAGTNIESSSTSTDTSPNYQLVDELVMERVKIQEDDSSSVIHAPLILIVEDNPDMNQFIRDTLSRHYRVSSAENGQSGLDKAITIKPDLILTDVMMPIMSGDQMVRAIRRHEELKDTPIVMLTAKADEQLRVQMLSESVQDYINKPFTVEELLARVGNLLIARKRARELLLAKAEELNYFFTVSLNLLCIADTDGYFQRLNPEWEKTLGYSLSDLEGKRFIEFIHPDDKAATLATVAKLRLQEEVLRFENRYRCKDGSYRWIEWSSKSLGKLIYAAAHDVTERKQAEEALRKSEEQFRSLSENSTDYIMRYDRQMRHIYANQACLRVSGKTWDEYIGKTHRELGADPELFELWEKKIQLVFDTGEPQQAIFEWKGAEGKVSLDWRVMPEFSTDGTVVSVLGVSRDISELKQTEKALRQAKEDAEMANRAKTEFLATMSHEIRTPMNAILGFTELLEKLITDPRQKSYLDAVQSGGKTLMGLINDILDLAKIESGKIPLQYESVNFHKFLEEVVQIFAQKIKQKNLEMILETEQSLPSFLILDELRLRQILFNLLGNAIKFTDKGYIRLTAASVSDTYDGNFIDLCITVEDTGIGIPQGECQRIFEAFHKFEPKGIRKYEGTGLGLSISKRLSETMGGELRLSSEEGKGSIFTLVLHRVEITSSADIIRRNELESLPDISTIAGTIMIVDDVDSNRQLIKESFSGTMITVTEAQNGQEALEKLRQEKPDLILMDLKMPIMDGFEACRRIKADSELKSIPIVAITASSLETRERLQNFDGYLRKPASLSDLFREINHHLYVFKDTKISSPAETEESLIENVENLDLLISKLTDSFLPRMESFKKRQPVKEVKQFGNDLVRLGEDFHSKILVSYGQSIVDSIEQFDLANVRRTLWMLPELIRQLECCKSTGDNKNESKQT